MDETLKITETYWEMLKSLNDDIKLRLATRLTASVVAGKFAHKDKTKEMIEKHMGKWKDERSAEDIIKDMYADRKSVIDDIDLFIGATAVATDCIMVTENVKHLNRIENIQIENWLLI